MKITIDSSLNSNDRDTYPAEAESTLELYGVTFYRKGRQYTYQANLNEGGTALFNMPFYRDQVIPYVLEDNGPELWFKVCPLTPSSGALTVAVQREDVDRVNDFFDFGVLVEC